MIAYQEFKVGDIPDVLEMWRKTPGIKLHDHGEDSVEGIRLCIERNRGLSFLAKENGNIVAAVLNGQDGRRGYIYHLIVKEEYRRQGIASKLLQMTEQKMSEEGIHKLALFVLNENETAQNFYRSIDWIEVKEAKTFAKVIL